MPLTQTQTLAQARRNRFEGLLPNGCKYLRLDYLGSRALGRDGPQAFLVEHPPSSEVPPHFPSEIFIFF